MVGAQAARTGWWLSGAVLGLGALLVFLAPQLSRRPCYREAGRAVDLVGMGNVGPGNQHALWGSASLWGGCHPGSGRNTERRGIEDLHPSCPGLEEAGWGGLAIGPVGFPAASPRGDWGMKDRKEAETGKNEHLGSSALCLE